METGGQKVFTLRVDPDAEPIAGRLIEEDGNEHQFAGWIGLAATLEELLGPNPRKAESGQGH
jgi:hypothetical protein